jgi:hypothetical protein
LDRDEVEELEEKRGWALDGAIFIYARYSELIMR